MLMLTKPGPQDVPNVFAFNDDLERLSAALEYGFGSPSSSKVDGIPFAQLAKIEKDFLQRARNLVLFSCFSYNAVPTPAICMHV